MLPEYLPYESEEAFVDYHITGYIPSGAYKAYSTREGISWLLPESFPILLKTVSVNGEQIEFRQSGEKLEYTKLDSDGNIIRGPDWMALMQTEEEVLQSGKPLYSTTVVAFNSENVPIGLASNEFGTDGVWVIDEYSGKGLGTSLLRSLRSQFKPDRRIGQATDAGIAMARSYYRQLEKEKNDLVRIWNEVHGIGVEQ